MIIHQSKNLSYEYLDTESPSKEQFFRHIHNEYEIFYFKKGDADYIVGSSVYHLKKNDLLIIKPAEYHQLKIISPAHYERHVINFTDKAIPRELIASFNKLHSIYSIGQDSTIDKLFDDFANLIETGKKTDDILLQVSYALKYMIASLNNAQHGVKREGLTANTALTAILKYIDKNPEKNLNTTVLSNKFFVSPSWLTHTFKKILGISVKQYINIKKAFYAQQLIAKGTKPTKVAEILSFDNYSTFYRLYKKYVGIIPLEDKRNNK